MSNYVKLCQGEETMEYTIYNSAGERIKMLREMNNFTREVLAEMADISPKFLYEIETGKKGFSADTLYRISKALAVQCDYILTGSKEDKCSSEILGIVQLFNENQMRRLCELLHTVYEMSTFIDNK